MKIKNVCALSGQIQKIRPTYSATYNYLYLKSSCSKDEKCYETEPGIYQCGKHITPHNRGEECSFNEECYSGICDMGKCYSLNSEQDCNEFNDPSNPEKACDPGYWCYQYDPINLLSKCVPYLNEGEVYNEDEGKICRKGLAPRLDETLEVRCSQIGFLQNGDISPNPIFCESGYSIGYENEEIIYGDDSKIYCFSIDREAPCEYDTSDGQYYCKPIVKGLDISVVEIKIQCNNINHVNICPYTIGKENSFKNYVNELKNLNFEEIYQDEDKYHKVGFGNNEYSQAYQKYIHYDFLYSMGILDDNGDVKKEKKNEWEYFWKMNFCTYLKFSHFFFLLFTLF